MKIIYRISDAGYNKVKPDYINNENCLKNFISIFGNQDLEIIADNCSKETLQMITKYCHPNRITSVSIGHGAGTFNLALDKALKYDDNEIIYYNYIAGNVLSNCFRAQANTVAASHITATAVFVPQLPAVTVWPTPDDTTTYTFVYWRMRRVQDAGAGVETADMNFRFLPCVVAGLAYYIAMKVPELQGRMDMLKATYDEQFNLAAGEDHEKAALRLVPRQSFIGSGGS